MNTTTTSRLSQAIGCLAPTRRPQALHRSLSPERRGLSEGVVTLERPHESRGERERIQHESIRPFIVLDRRLRRQNCRVCEMGNEPSRARDQQRSPARSPRRRPAHYYSVSFLSGPSLNTQTKSVYVPDFTG